MENNLPDSGIKIHTNSPLSIIILSLIFFLAGLILGYFLRDYYPVVNTFPKTKITCTPRPPCLDATPKCLIPETSDMCPPVTPLVTPTPLIAVFKDVLHRFQITIPGDWKIEESNNPQTFSTFQAPDGSIFNISVLDTKAQSLTDFITKQDKSDLTSWEGQPSRKIISTEKTTIAGLPAIQRIEKWLAADYTTINTYTLVNNTVYSFYIQPVEIPYDQTEVFKKYQEVLSTFEPLSSSTSYVCPQTEYVDCMPGPNKPVKTECTTEFLNWAQVNCPNFKGAAL